MNNLTDATSEDSVAALPDADVVIYDGKCQFCQRQADRIKRYDRQGRLVLISLHDPQVQRWFPDLGHDELMQQMYVIDRAGRRRGGAAAVAYLSRRIPRLWPLVPLLHIPGMLPIWQWCYRQVAKRRYSLQGDQCESGCDVHFK